MSKLPSGTVTFLFTDVQDSTRLWEKYPADMRVALKRHDEIIESLAKQHNGFVVRPRGEGDSRFVVFERAIDGVTAAAAIQRALHTETWPEQTPLYVRMSLHTGEGEFRDGDYYGTAVNRCARLRGIAHGGQTVISKTTYELATEVISPADEYLDLGEHPLKGMQEPERVFQLSGAGLPSEFPPLKSPDDVEEPPAPGKPPFKGLQHFDETDAGLFFGRELLTAKIVSRLREGISPEGDGESFLALIVGASGSGKSSLVRAGLIPALKESESWPVHVITPGDRPLRALANSLNLDTLKEEMLQNERGLHQAVRRMLGEGDGEHLLLVVDQFEELFTLCRDEIERKAFVDNLLTAVAPETNGPTIVVIVLRADFYGHCAQYANLREALANRQEFIGPMTQEELQRAIEEPARQADWEFEPGLVDMLLQEVGDEPGALPLLSHALLETWQRRRGRTMTFTGYAESGGIRGAIAKTAEWVYWRMSPEEQAITRNLFLRLTELGEGTDEGGMPSPDTRRRVMLTELLPDIEEAPAARAATEEVLQILVDARLITTAEETAEVAHEALIREWPTLREWLNEDREGLLLHRHLTETAQEWQRLERASSELYRGKRLTQVLEWSWDHRDELNALEGEFLDASLADRRARQAAEEERQAKEAALEARSRRFLRALVGVFAVATVVAVILSIFAFNQQGIAQDNAATATVAQGLALHEAATSTVAQGEAQIQAATAVAAQEEAKTQADRADVAAADAIEQKNIAEQEARTALESYSLSLAANAQEALNDLDTATALVLANAANAIDQPPQRSQQILRQAAYSPGARQRFVIADIFQDVVGTVEGIDISPDGRTALLGFEDGTLILWDIETGKEVRRLVGHTRNIWYVIFSPDGERALSVGSWDGTAIYWKLSTGEQILRIDRSPYLMAEVAIHPNGHIAVIGETIMSSVEGVVNPVYSSNVVLWDLETGQEIRKIEGLKGTVQEMEFSPDGTKVLVGCGLETEGSKGYWFLWDLENDQDDIQIEELGNEEIATTVAISPDGRTALIGLFPRGEIYHWDLESMQLISIFEGHTRTVSGLSFVPQSHFAISSSFDNTLILWDLDTAEPITQFKIHTNDVLNMDISPNGRIALSSSLDGTLILWDLFSADEIRRFVGHTSTVSGLAFTSDGKHVFSSAGFNIFRPFLKEEYTIRLWDLDAGEQVINIDAPPDGGELGFLAGDLSPDGITALTGSTDNLLKLWNIETGEVIRSYAGHDDWVAVVEISPDGKKALSGTLRTPNLFLWDLETGEVIRKVVQDVQYPGTMDVAFSPDGKTALYATFDGPVVLLDLESGEEINRFIGHSDWVNNVAFTPDGRRAASCSRDGTVILWNIETGKEIHRYFEPDQGMHGLAITPDGKSAMIGLFNGTVILWDLESGKVIHRYFGHTERIWLIDISSDGRTAVTSGEDFIIIQWQLVDPPLDELLEWIETNRYMRELTCEERDLYRIGECE